MKRPRVLRNVLMGCGIAAALVLGASFVRPAGFAVGHAGARVARGSLEIAWTNADLGYASVGWRMSGPGVNARIVVGPANPWRPNTTNASMTVGTGGPGGVTSFWLRAVFVPLWWVVVAFGAAAFGVQFLPATPAPGTCRGCGYELRGVTGDKCPECGEGRASRLRRVLKVIRFYWVCAPERRPSASA